MTDAPTDFDVAVEACARIARQARVVVDAIQEDECGALVAGQYAGGNGGLISRATLAKVEKLRQLLTELGA